MSVSKPTIDRIYLHVKTNNLYELLTRATLLGGEETIVYRNVSHLSHWYCRPLTMFFEVGRFQCILNHPLNKTLHEYNTLLSQLIHLKQLIHHTETDELYILQREDFNRLVLYNIKTIDPNAATPTPSPPPYQKTNT